LSRPHVPPSCNPRHTRSIINPESGNRFTLNRSFEHAEQRTSAPSLDQRATALDLGTAAHAATALTITLRQPNAGRIRSRLLQVDDEHAVFNGRWVAHRCVSVDTKCLRERLTTDDPIVCMSLFTQFIRARVACIDWSKANKPLLFVVKQFDGFGFTDG
jgi:hypothetical protein